MPKLIFIVGQQLPLLEEHKKKYEHVVPYTYTDAYIMKLNPKNVQLYDFTVVFYGCLLSISFKYLIRLTFWSNNV